MAAATRVANVAVLFCACPECLHQAASMGKLNQEVRKGLAATHWVMNGEDLRMPPGLRH